MNASSPVCCAAPKHLTRWLVAVLLGLMALPAMGDDIARNAVPRKWVEQFLPEDLPAMTFPKYYKDLDKARAMAFAGRYKLALMTLAKVTKGDPGEMAIIKGTCLWETGRDEEAIKALSDPAVVDKPRVQVMRARIMADQGRFDEAVALLKEHVAKNPKSIIGLFYLGETCERKGDMIGAKDAYTAVHDQAFEKWGSKPDAFDNAEEVTCMGRAFDRWATLTGQYQKQEMAGLSNIILKVFIAAYDTIDTAYWPAHLAAAEYCLERDNQKEGGKELAAALAGNPNSRQAHMLACGVALSQWNFDAGDAQIAALRAVNPNSVEASLLECRNYLQQRRPKEALTPVMQVLAKQPKNVEAMGLQASVYALQLNDAKVKELLDKVDQLYPGNASAYLDVAEQLGAMRQYPRAAAMYKVAIDRAPWWTAARNGLGLLYTQSGDEDLARKELEMAKLIDPFNHRTHNYLILLDFLDKMTKVETAHFVISFDPKLDPAIPEYFGTYMESIHALVCGDFKHEPAVKTYIEVFPSHDQFSVRTTGSPWIGTVGASTGRVIALVAPRKGEGTMGTYNWATVLRHEYTHTVTLSATDNRIAHWLTEGLAVQEERNPIRWEWVPMLFNAVKNKQLFKMDNITWGFVRPKRPTDRSLAYAQSAWICQYIEETWSHDTMLKMLEEFRKGKEQDEVFQKLLGKSLSQFDTEFGAWTEKQVAKWGYDPETSKKYDALVKKADAAKDNHKEAAKLWEEIAKLRPVDALPHQRLAGLYLMDDSKDTDKAVEHLLALHKVSLKDNRYAKKIARVYSDAGDTAKAEKYGMEAVYIEPYDQEAHELLASIYEKSGNKDGLAREKRVIPMLEQLVKEARKANMMPGAPEVP